MAGLTSTALTKCSRACEAFPSAANAFARANAVVRLLQSVQV